MRQLQGVDPGDRQTAETIRGVDRDLRLIDQALAEVKANPTEPALRAATARMRPAIRRVSVRVKQLYDAKEQGFFGALSGALNARQSSERLLVGLSGLVLFVGLALALSLRQRRQAEPHPPAAHRGRGHRGAPSRPPTWSPSAGLPLRPPLDARTMTELLTKTVGDGGFYLPMTAQPVEQAAVP